MAENWKKYLEYEDSNFPIMSSHTFYAPLLTSNSVVVDLGGSTAAFSKAISALFGCKCYVVEATSHNFNRIAETDLISKFHFAIAEKDGMLKLDLADEEYHWGSAHLPGAFRSKGSEDVMGITFPSFLDEINVSSPDLVKVDIEGAEFALFSKSSDKVLQSVGQFTVEFHDFLQPGLGKDVRLLKERMLDLGFHIFSFSRIFNGDVLFINRNAANFSVFERIYVSVFLRGIRGIRRISSRYVGSSSI